MGSASRVRRGPMARRWWAIGVAALALVAVFEFAYGQDMNSYCGYYTNCGACVADTRCGWCGNDPHGTGGYGDVNTGDHIEAIAPGTLRGGIGRISDVSTTTVTGVNTRFTQQFVGKAEFNIDIGGTDAVVSYVVNDTQLELTADPSITLTADSWFGYAKREGTGALSLNAEVTSRPNSATTETRTITGTSTVFTKELKVGYWLTFYTSNAVDYRVITEIESDIKLKVDRALPSGWTATATNWGYVSCPPRIGKRAVGLGTIESLHDQGATSATAYGYTTPAASVRTHPATASDYTVHSDTGYLVDASGSATMSQHVIHGKGTRFESQFGLASTWDAKFHESGPWMSVQINGDWETVRVAELGTTTTFANYVALLENSFSEPILKATHWEWYPMLTKGYGTVRSYGKRVVSNSWDNKEGFVDYQGNTALAAGSLSSQGTYGDTRFLTQLRTGYTITACGQTRMVNSIQSDVELTIDRPFTLGNREFIPAASSPGDATLTSLSVRGLTRLLPLWPRGVTVTINPDGTGLTTSDTFSYKTYWKTFSNPTNTVTITAAWYEIVDSGTSNTGIGVYIKWDATKTTSANSQWRLHVADIENCRYYISTEGERYMTDDNAAPPVCYNHGKCVPANSADSKRPVTALTGTMTIDYTSGAVVGTGTQFLNELSPGDILRDAANEESRVLSVASATSATVAAVSGATDITVAAAVSVLKCAGGKFATSSGNHDDRTTHEVDDEAGAYLPHPLHSFYQTWSHKYCEIDPGCCGFRVSSIVDPQRYAYYFVKPDHGDYNFRIAVHTVNDNLDLYAHVGAAQPISTTTGVHTSVRESVPWAIDIDEADVICAGETGSDYGSGHLDTAALGGDTATTVTTYTYATALGHYIHVDESPNCDQISIGVMGDNRYPQTVGASEYSARVYMEFNFPNFDCAIDGSTAESARGENVTYTSHCVRHNLRFSGDAQAVKVTATSADSTLRYVVRLTEAYMRTSGESATAPGTAWKSSTDFRTSQRVGAVWWHRKVHIWDGFETNFEFRITSPTQCGAGDGICDGADGFAFVISNDDRQENVTSPWSNTGWACDQADGSNTGETYKLCGYGPDHTNIGHGFVGCPGDGLGYGESTQVDSADFGGVAANCRSGLKKSLAVEFDTFYNVERRDPKQGKQHWWINATEYVSYNDNHLGVFMSTAPYYANQPWPLSSSDIVTELKADHSDDKEGAHFGSTPSVPTMADGLTHTVKIRYTRGFTTQKAGSGTVTTTDDSGSDKRALVGSSTKFKTELRTGFEFGYGGRVKANVKVQINRDQTLTTTRGQSGNIITTGFGDDNEACRVVSISSDTAALLEDISTGGSDPDPPDAFRKLQHVPFDPVQGGGVSYDIIKEFPGEIQVFIDDMDRYVFQVAVEDRDMAKVLDTDGNAFIGLTASTGSKGFAKVGYQAAEVHQNHDILSWNYCSSPGCVPY